ncbi:hypothetical protein COU37_05445 [Candidatus Micrarchaeota archaeon CG10_big_fil_rev_8_21_14_0_10_45_29]|nr:MAG: hypothetical protein COU37_05445 [Candidatus Micrarchaeota archaeon CG10_big_fil_rev_8_21_14_0_10_45_29]
MPPRYLDPKVKLVWFLPTAVALLIIWLIAFFAIIFAADTNSLMGMSKPVFLLVLAIVLTVFIGIPAYAYHHIEYMSYTYAIEESEFVIREGVITRHTTVIPYNRIQNINTTRSLLERLLGLASLQIETAGSTTHAEGHLPGVINKDALIAEIMQKVEGAKRRRAMGGSQGENIEKTQHQLLSEILKELSQLNNNLQSFIERGKSR